MGKGEFFHGEKSTAGLSLWSDTVRQGGEALGLYKPGLKSWPRHLEVMGHQQILKLPEPQFLHL